MKPIGIGQSFRTLNELEDSDENDCTRWTPVGAVGTITRHNNNDVWDLVFPHGAWLCPTEADLRDPEQFVEVIFVDLDDRELASILCALRLLQQVHGECAGELTEDLEFIRDNAGSVEPLDLDEVDDLCERLSTAA